ncbi:hypothetical protein Sjap_017746 [Stephania japonica]|uniref:Zinc knuckle CX2CX4HX4C domain-containing protein n=1 Tax=Stephania japonica TaxID=461633 RepID=A0AAP0I6Q4_9MAGN
MRCKIWVQIHGLPGDCRGEEAVKEVVCHIGKFIALKKLNKIILDRYKRVRMEINVKNPLMRGRFIRKKDKRYWVDFIYERIKFACAYCGKITHKSKSCDQFVEGVS